MGTSWDSVCLQVSLGYVLPVARTCAISLHHGTKYPLRSLHRAVEVIFLIPLR